MAHLRRLSTEGVSYYIVQKGAYAAGTVLLKLIDRQKHCRLLTQQRNMDGKLEWIDASHDNREEEKVDLFIRRAISRDPDIWVVEIEGRDLTNPFQENVS